uniref:Uncharacterized protein n=1 Tax=Helianthus annuus TaxID=4232 RepID=A0A251VN19_HELAN
MDGKYNYRRAFSLPSIFTSSLIRPQIFPSVLQYLPQNTTHTRPISKITTTYTNRHQTHPTFNPSCIRRTPTNRHLHPRLRNHHHWSSSLTTHQHPNRFFGHPLRV